MPALYTTCTVSPTKQSILFEKINFYLLCWLVKSRLGNCSGCSIKYRDVILENICYFVCYIIESCLARFTFIHWFLLYLRTIYVIITGTPKYSVIVKQLLGDLMLKLTMLNLSVHCELLNSN